MGGAATILLVRAGAEGCREISEPLSEAFCAATHPPCRVNPRQRRAQIILWAEPLITPRDRVGRGGRVPMKILERSPLFQNYTSHLFVFGHEVWVENV